MKIIKNLFTKTVATPALGGLLAILLGASGCSSNYPIAKKPAASVTRDYRVLFEGRVIGQVFIETNQFDNVVRTTETTKIATQFRGMNSITNIIRETHEEDTSGHPLALQKQIIIPHALRKISAEIINNELRIRDQRGDQGIDTTRPLPVNFLLHQGVRDKMREAAREAKPVFYSEWSFEQQKFVDITLEARRENNTENAWHIHKESLGNGRRQAEEYLVDDEFYPLRTQINYLGKQLVIERCQQPCPAENLQALRPLDQQLLNSPYQITGEALTGHIRYQMQAAIKPPATGEQQVHKEGDLWIVDICAHCGPDKSSAPENIAQYLSANAWLESSDSRLLAAARNAISPQDTADIKMAMLARLTRKRLEKNTQFSGYASALQAYQNRAGDCTEYALLLAALGRAAGIPTRVLFGLSYTREQFHGHKHVFAPHAWVQAWIGNSWRSYDAALENFDAGHIALNISDGDQNDFNAIFENFARLKIVSAQQIVKAKHD